MFSLGIAKYEAVLCGVPVKPRKSFGVLKSVVVHILVLLYHYIQSQTCVMLAFARKCDLRKGIGVGVVVAHSPVHSVLYAVVEVLLLVLDGAVRRHDVQVYSVIFGGFQHFFQIPGGSYVEEILPPAFKDHFGLDAAVVIGGKRIFFVHKEHRPFIVDILILLFLGRRGRFRFGYGYGDGLARLGVFGAFLVITALKHKFCKHKSKRQKQRRYYQ